MKIFFILFVSILALFAKEKEIVFGVVPQQSPLILSKKWMPIMEELSKSIGRKVVFKTEPSIPKFEQALYDAQYDISYMNPYHFVIANKKQGYLAIARASQMIQGIVVANKNFKLDLNNIRGSKFLFPAPNAFAATLLTKYELMKKYGIDVDKECEVLYVNSHDSVYKAIARNIGDLGGGINRTFENLSDEPTKENLKVVYETDKYPSHAIAINPKLDSKLQKKIQEAMLKISPQLLKELNIEKIIETSSKEYDSVKDLAIKLDIYN